MGDGGLAAGTATGAGGASRPTVVIAGPCCGKMPPSPPLDTVLAGPGAILAWIRRIKGNECKGKGGDGGTRTDYFGNEVPQRSLVCCSALIRLITICLFHS